MYAFSSEAALHGAKCTEGALQLEKSTEGASPDFKRSTEQASSSALPSSWSRGPTPVTFAQVSDALDTSWAFKKQQLVVGMIYVSASVRALLEVPHPMCHGLKWWQPTAPCWWHEFFCSMLRSLRMMSCCRRESYRGRALSASTAAGFLPHTSLQARPLTPFSAPIVVPAALPLGQRVYELVGDEAQDARVVDHLGIALCCRNCGLCSRFAVHRHSAQQVWTALCTSKGPRGGVAPDVHAMDAADLDSTHAHLLASYTSKPPLPNPLSPPPLVPPFQKAEAVMWRRLRSWARQRAAVDRGGTGREAPPQRAESHGAVRRSAERGGEERGGADDDQLTSQTSAVEPSPTMPWSPSSYARLSLSAGARRKRRRKSRRRRGGRSRRRWRRRRRR